jgi:hypothetical protein
MDIVNGTKGGIDAKLMVRMNRRTGEISKFVYKLPRQAKLFTKGNRQYHVEKELITIEQDGAATYVTSYDWYFLLSTIVKIHLLFSLL